MSNPHPLGHFVLVEVKKVEEITEGGIILPEDLSQKEQAVEQIGTVIEIGPTAYKEWPGCDSDNPADDWGISVGDTVEFKKYEGKSCYIEGHERLRYIPDTHIVGVIK